MAGTLEMKGRRKGSLPLADGEDDRNLAGTDPGAYNYDPVSTTAVSAYN